MAQLIAHKLHKQWTQALKCALILKSVSRGASTVHDHWILPHWSRSRHLEKIKTFYFLGLQDWPIMSIFLCITPETSC